MLPFPLGKFLSKKDFAVGRWKKREDYEDSKLGEMRLFDLGQGF